MQPGQIKAVIFDMDGVLTDSEPLINAAAIAMFKELGLIVQPEDFLPFVGMGEDRYLNGVAEKHQFPIDLAGAKKRTYEIYLELVPARLRAFPGAVELVRACAAAGLKLAVASSADMIKIRANLNQIGLPLETWNAVVCGDEVERKKPAPDIFLAAAAKLGVAAAECCVVEDAMHGVVSAKAAGMRCVAVAQTFAMEKLTGADLVRLRMADLSVADIASTCVAPPPIPVNSIQTPVTELSPQSSSLSESKPWGFWATVGLAALVYFAFIFAQIVAAAGYVAMRALTDGKAAFDVTNLVAQLQSNGLFLSITVYVSSPVMIGLSVLFASRRRGLPIRDYLALRAVRWKTYLWSGLALLGFVLVNAIISKLAQRPDIPEFMLQAYRNAGNTPLLWFAVIFAAPASEEIFFRGFMFEGLRRSNVGGMGAVFFTALFWAAIHAQYELFEKGVIFAMGILFGVTRLKSNSLYPCLFMHALMNLLATIETAIAVAN